MEIGIKRLWNRDFILVVIGQIVSLFGNSILRFSLSLYILKVTESATIFGSINAVAMIPTVLLTPFGGMIADRLNRRNVMVVLDFATALLIFLFAVTLIDRFAVVLIATAMIILSVIQSFYTPSVQSSVPFLQMEKNFVRANAIVNQVSMLANLIGPVLGGFLFAFIGIRTIVAVSGISFFLSAILEIFIKIPFVKRPLENSLLTIVKKDFKESLIFMTKDQPVMFKIAVSITALNFFAAALVSVGVPFLITTVLGLADSFFGIALGLMAAAGIAGGLSAGIISNKLKLSKLYYFYIVLALCLIPIAPAFIFNFNPFVIYVVIVTAVMTGQLSASIIAIFLLSAVQKRTPQFFLGKIMAFINTLTMCIMPLGSLVYGILFDVFASMIYVVVAFASISLLMTGILSRKAFRSLD